MCTDKHCGTENKNRTIKDNNNKFSTFKDMLLLFTPICDQPLSISATLYISFM